MYSSALGSSAERDVETQDVVTGSSSDKEQKNFSFSLADFNTLALMYTTAHMESDEAQELFVNFIGYLYEVIENFEQGIFCRRKHSVH